MKQDRPPLASEVFMFALAYTRACNPATGDPSTIPIYANSAIAIEFGLSTLLRLDDKWMNSDGDLNAIFRELTPETQKAASEAWDRCVARKRAQRDDGSSDDLHVNLEAGTNWNKHIRQAFGERFLPHRLIGYEHDLCDVIIDRKPEWGDKYGWINYRVTP